MRIAIYITSHGFGHATRQSALASEFIKLGIECHIVSDRPTFLFPEESTLFKLHSRQTDTGMFQTNWQNPDINKTILTLKKFWSNKESFIEREINFLKKYKIDFIVADVPPLPMLAAHKVGVPIYGMTNFDWYFNYKELKLTTPNPEFKAIIQEIYDIYQLCEKSYILPFSTPESISGLPNQIKVGNLAKSDICDRDKLCKKYDIDPYTIIALITFGGIVSDINYFKDILSNTSYTFISNVNLGDYDTLRVIAPESNYSEIISSVDVVISKVGYSTLAETCAAGTYLYYATRDNFPEDDALVTQLADYPNSEKFSITANSLDINLLTERPTKLFLDEFKLCNSEIALTIVAQYCSRFNKLSASIDFGTNNSTLLICSQEGANLKVLLKDVKVTRIGASATDFVISKEGIDYSVKQLSSQLDLCKALEITPRIIATNIGRKYTNFNKLKKVVRQTYGYPIKVISSIDEAKLGVEATIKLKLFKSPFYNIDIGGSSIEISAVDSNNETTSISLDRGILSYYKIFTEYPLAPEDIKEGIFLDFTNQFKKRKFNMEFSTVSCGIGELFQNLLSIYHGHTSWQNYEKPVSINASDFVKKLTDYILPGETEKIFYDFDGKELDRVILYSALACVENLTKMLSIKTLVISPLGIPLALATKRRKRINVQF